MASTSSTRRVLSDLSVNAALVGKAVSTPLKPSSSKLFGEVRMVKGENTVTVVGLAETKRGVDDMLDGESASKRRKISVSDERGFQSPSPQSSPPITPMSSFGNTISNALNESQNTVLTIPDNFSYQSSPLQPSSPLTPDQLRSKAKAIRLRLSLASYKVRTNQIDVPISRLEIRSSQSLPQLRRAASNTSSNRSASQRTALPDKPAAENPLSPPLEHGMSVNGNGNTSAPVSPRKGLEDYEGEFATPILQRQRLGLLNPPFLGDVERERGGDLNNSIVQKRALDGLLSLARMAN